MGDKTIFKASRLQHSEKGSSKLKTARHAKKEENNDVSYFNKENKTLSICFTKLKDSTTDQNESTHTDTVSGNFSFAQGASSCFNGTPKELNDCQLNSNSACRSGDETLSCDSPIYTDDCSSHPKEQETYLYRLTVLLFATDTAYKDSIETVLDELVEKADFVDTLSELDRQKILAAYQQYMDSLELCNKKALEEMQKPLSIEEKQFLKSIPQETWVYLSNSVDPLDQYQLESYMKLQLRKFNTSPRNARPKTCLHCDTTYTASTSLRAHLESLAGIRIWRCSKCKDSNKPDTTFTRKHSLRYHILKENDIPRYICLEPGCNRKHNHTHHQKSHAKQHASEKDLQCCIEGCAMIFQSRNALSRHLLQVHNMKLLGNSQFKRATATKPRPKIQTTCQKVKTRSKIKKLEELDNTCMQISASNPSHTPLSKKRKMESSENVNQTSAFKEKTWEDRFEAFKAQIESGEIDEAQLQDKFVELFGSLHHSFNLLHFVSCFEFKGIQARTPLPEKRSTTDVHCLSQDQSKGNSFSPMSQDLPFCCKQAAVMHPLTMSTSSNFNRCLEVMEESLITRTA